MEKTEREQLIQESTGKIKSVKNIETTENTSDDISKNESNRKENKKALKIFIPLLITAVLIGGAAGASIMYFDIPSMVAKYSGMAGELLQLIGYWGVIITALIGYIYPRVIYKQCRGEYEKCILEARSAQTVQIADSESDGDTVDGDTVDEVEPDEEIIYKIDKKLSDAMQVLSITTILQMMCYGMGVCNLSVIIEKHFALWGISTVVFVIGIYFSMKNQQLLIDFTKIMNPELEGSVYDMKFHEKWEESCDEMAKLFIYKSSYKAYRAGNIACVVLWIIAAFLGMSFGAGPLPVIFVSIIWLVMSMAYCNEAKKLDKY